MISNNVPQSNHRISLAEAIELTTRFRDNRNSILGSVYQDQDLLPLSETFNKTAFESFMNNDLCAGIRIYYGMTPHLKLLAIMVGVNENNEDMLPSDTETTDPEPPLLDDAQRCPPICPPSSSLNTNEP